MLLVIDAGNTNITLGVFLKDELLFVARSATRRKKTSDEYAYDMLNMFILHGLSARECSGVIISSVVPEITASLQSAADLITGCKPVLLSSTTRCGLEILTDRPAELGADMIAGAMAVKAGYSLPAVVADFGTATKLYVLDKNGAFIGCTIAAGIGTSLSALSSGASQLPAVSLRAPRKVIGTNTVDCMQSGAVYGAACLLDGMIDRFEKELGYKFSSIVVTGGYSAPIIGHSYHDITHDKNLLLRGLKLIYEMNGEKL